MVLVAPRQNRPAGTYTGELAPALIPAGTTTVRGELLMDEADRANTATAVTFRVEGSFDPVSVPEASATWITVLGGQFFGGISGKTGTTNANPTLRLYSPSGVPSRLRGFVVTNRTMSWSVDVTVG